ncbi:palmitoyltransferase ZDHHC6-like protein [Dinothrombium tinctorium]|uniref:Palmitoyltransferase n=1 Tax=Dinothrombium tinctorium TaxID=1965070 RepID=A0A443RHK8_9ACAR|nr:palmitoyltransferase ZDHHC6-like protein [Dinothrombium tinctorium]RWS15183.1 palmitoyltransferase ZDHHC6-like protein [Dinothrombium tinctorium]
MWPHIKRLLHWGPLLALSITKCITLTTLYLTGMWLPPSHSWLAFANHIVFLAMVGVTLYNFFCAVLIGPGYLPLQWVPNDKRNTRYLQYCQICDGYKAPRSHHCRKCNRCVLKMDHHCPWINNCCGHFNHFYFVCFLFYSVLGSMHSLFLLVSALYRAYYALKIILRNKTSVEEWIVAKAESRDRNDNFEYPYDLGKWENFKQVFFLMPGNGIDWPLVDGCNDYTLTVSSKTENN